MFSRFADILFRFRLKALILLLLTVHTLAMIAVAVAALRQGSGEASKCEFIHYIYSIKQSENVVSQAEYIMKLIS